MSDIDDWWGMQAPENDEPPPVRRLEYSLPSTSMWDSLEPLPKDVSDTTMEKFREDDASTKIDLSTGVFRTSTMSFRCVAEVEKSVAHELYPSLPTPPRGNVPFLDHCEGLLLGYGHDLSVAVASVQTPGTTCALRVIAEALAACPVYANAHIAIPRPCAASHTAVFKASGFAHMTSFPWLTPTGGFDEDGIFAALKGAPDSSVFVFNAIAHNPTGYDFSLEQWDAVAQIAVRKNHFIVVDASCLGFVHGDPSADAFAVRALASAGCEFGVALSFSRNLGMQGARVGAAMMFVKTPAARQLVQLHLEQSALHIWRYPVASPAVVVCSILTDPERLRLWHQETSLRSGRLIERRSLLRAALQDAMRNIAEYENAVDGKDDRSRASRGGRGTRAVTDPSRGVEGAEAAETVGAEGSVVSPSGGAEVRAAVDDAVACIGRPSGSTGCGALSPSSSTVSDADDMMPRAGGRRVVTSASAFWGGDIPPPAFTRRATQSASNSPLAPSAISPLSPQQTAVVSFSRGRRGGGRQLKRDSRPGPHFAADDVNIRDGGLEPQPLQPLQLPRGLKATKKKMRDWTNSLLVDDAKQVSEMGARLRGGATMLRAPSIEAVAVPTPTGDVPEGAGAASSEMGGTTTNAPLTHRSGLLRRSGAVPSLVSMSAAASVPRNPLPVVGLTRWGANRTSWVVGPGSPLAHWEAFTGRHAFDSVTKQRGFFWYSGLSSVAVEELRERNHIYVASDGRLSVASLQAPLIARTARAIALVLARHGSSFASPSIEEVGGASLSPTAAADVDVSASLVCEVCGHLSGEGR